MMHHHFPPWFGWAIIGASVLGFILAEALARWTIWVDNRRRQRERSKRL